MVVVRFDEDVIGLITVLDRFHLGEGREDGLAKPLHDYQLGRSHDLNVTALLRADGRQSLGEAFHQERVLSRCPLIATLVDTFMRALGRGRSSGRWLSQDEIELLGFTQLVDLCTHAPAKASVTHVLEKSS